VAGPEHTLDASGLHVTLRRGGAAAGSISLVRIASGEHDTDDAPLELIETTPAETVIRNIFVRAGNPGNG